MRYVIIDMEGSSLDYSSSLQGTREILEKIESEQSGNLEDLFILAYDDDGRRINDPQSAQEVLGK